MYTNLLTYGSKFNTQIINTHLDIDVLLQVQPTLSLSL